jgi:hypothetical protein
MKSELFTPPNNVGVKQGTLATPLSLDTCQRMASAITRKTNVSWVFLFALNQGSSQASLAHIHGITLHWHYIALHCIHRYIDTLDHWLWFSPKTNMKNIHKSSEALNDLGSKPWPGRGRCVDLWDGNQSKEGRQLWDHFSVSPQWCANLRLGSERPVFIDVL